MRRTTGVWRSFAVAALVTGAVDLACGAGDDTTGGSHTTSSTSGGSGGTGGPGSGPATTTSSATGSSTGPSTSSAATTTSGTTSTTGATTGTTSTATGTTSSASSTATTATAGTTGAGGAATTGSGGSTGAGGSATGGGAGGMAGAAGRGGSAGSGGAGGGVRDAGAGGAGGSGAIDGGDLVSQLLRITQGCAKVLSSHTYALDNNQKVNICGLNGAAYWTADMDIDCDGRDVGDGKCPGPDPSYQNDTAFHNSKDQPLAASLDPYVVIPQDFKTTGLAGGNVVAVIYKNKLEFAVFGDTGPTDIIGEASYACAAGLGINPNPANGGAPSGVTYIAFTMTGSKPSDIEDQTATATLGQQLAQKLIQMNP